MTKSTGQSIRGELKQHAESYPPTMLIKHTQTGCNTCPGSFCSSFFTAGCYAASMSA